MTRGFSYSQCRTLYKSQSSTAVAPNHQALSTARLVNHINLRAIRLLASLAVLVPLVISAVLAPVKAKTFDDIVAQFEETTQQLADTGTVATDPLTSDTFPVLLDSINASTVSLQRLEVIVDLARPLPFSEATTIVKTLQDTFVPTYAQMASQIVKDKPGFVAINRLQDGFVSVVTFVKAMNETCEAFMNKLPPNTPNALALRIAISAESNYLFYAYTYIS